MDIKRIILAGLASVASGVMAADPGGVPGFAEAIFSSTTFDTTSDIAANVSRLTCTPDLYPQYFGQYTTVGARAYMYLEGGITYNFRYMYGNEAFATLIINGQTVLRKVDPPWLSKLDADFTPPASDWYPVELRAGCEGSNSGIDPSIYYGLQWKKATELTYSNFVDPGDGSVFKTGALSALHFKETTPVILSSTIRANDPTILDVMYKVISAKSTVNVRALAFEDGERSFWKVVRPETFIDGTDKNIGDGIAANVEHRLSWKVSKDWATDLAKVKFEVLTSEMGQLPIKKITIPATPKNPAMTVAYDTYTDRDIFNAMLWYYADGVDDLINNNGYVDATYGYPNQVDTTPRRLVDRTTLPNRMESLRYVLNKMGWEPLEGGNLLDYVRKATRKNLWYNSGTQNAAILKSTKPTSLYLGEKAYCVIDVSGGPSASSYPVSYLDTEPVGGWSDEYKTTKILLRRVEATCYMMQKNKEVTLTKPYYMGVYTVTQKQYVQVMGSNPTQSDHQGDLRPVEISWSAIRGDSSIYNWPTVKTVDPNTFVGKIQAKTGLNFDLPTEAQWENACRAGTSTKYNNGGDDGGNYCEVGNKDVNLLGRFWTDQTVGVGLFLPNLWGVYDMHGNVGQWCLDYIDGYSSDPAVDYAGAESGSDRAVRGCLCRNLNDSATSFYRYGVAPSSSRYKGGVGNWFTYFGFRLSSIIVK